MDYMSPIRVWNRGILEEKTIENCVSLCGFPYHLDDGGRRHEFS